MKFYDITVPLCPGLPSFPGDPRVEIEPVTTLAGGDIFNVSRIAMCTHSGTHLDPPRHCDEQGMAVDDLPISLLIGDALLFEIAGKKEIGRDELAHLPLEGTERLLLRTDNSLLWKMKGFCAEFCHLTPEGARFLVERGVKLFGMDYLSVERWDGNGEVHQILLRNGVAILEGLNLDGIESGNYQLICLPLKIKGGDGGPARAVLRVKEQSDAARPGRGRATG